MIGAEERARQMSGRTISNSKYRMLIVLMVIILIALALLALCTGRYTVKISDVIKLLWSKFLTLFGGEGLEASWDPFAEGVVFTLRLPRIAAAMLIGGALSLSGAAYQGVFKNPLVSPDILGVSTGACVGAAIAILLHLNSVGIQLLAFISGIVTVLLTVAIPKLMRNDSVTMLVLAGVIVSGIMSSLMGVIKYLADPETELADITYWQMGSFAKVTDTDVLTVAVPILAAAALLIAMRWQINILSLGDSEAKTLGVKIGVVRGVIIFCATLLTACAVCICGTIGWVGLVIPHLSRMLVGPDNIKSVPIAFVLGGVFMLVVDTVARALTTLEIPLSILTGLIGAPFYLYILVKQRMKMS
ncbi:MAG: FecCD family ABC transporter permease [Oscillospiraceae bacterium]